MFPVTKPCLVSQVAHPCQRRHRPSRLSLKGQAAWDTNTSSEALYLWNLQKNRDCNPLIPFVWKPTASMAEWLFGASGQADPSSWRPFSQLVAGTAVGRPPKNLGPGNSSSSHLRGPLTWNFPNPPKNALEDIPVYDSCAEKIVFLPIVSSFFPDVRDDSCQIVADGKGDQLVNGAQPMACQGVHHGCRRSTLLVLFGAFCFSYQHRVQASRLAAGCEWTIEIHRGKQLSSSTKVGIHANAEDIQLRGLQGCSSWEG